jgi:hypothetical protein
LQVLLRERVPRGRGFLLGFNFILKELVSGRTEFSELF